MLRPKRGGVKAAGIAPLLAWPRRVRYSAAQHRLLADSEPLDPMNEPRPRELDVLAESNRLLTSTLDLTEVLDRLADMARTRLETDVARIWLLDEGGGMLHLSAHK